MWGLLGGYETVSIKVRFPEASISSQSLWKVSGEQFTVLAFSVGEREGEQAHVPWKDQLLGDYNGCRGPCGLYYLSLCCPGPILW